MNQSRAHVGRPIPHRALLIMNEAATAYEVSVADLIGPCRRRPIAYARFVAMTQIRELRNEAGERVYSLPRIGAIFGGRDHTTVINALRQAERLALPTGFQILLALPNCDVTYPQASATIAA